MLLGAAAVTPSADTNLPPRGAVVSRRDARSAGPRRTSRLGVLLASLVLALCRAATVQALDVPPLSRRITDLAGALNATAIRELDTTLSEHERRSHHQFAVLIIPGLEGEVLESYSLKVARQWRLGDRKRNDGLLVLVAIRERAVRVEVGPGLEGAIPDIVAARVIRNEMAPRFKDQDYAGGLGAGLDALMAAADGGEVQSAPRKGLEAIWPQTVKRFQMALFIAVLAYGAYYLLTMERLTKMLLLGVLGGLGGLFLRSMPLTVIFALAGLLLGFLLPVATRDASPSSRSSRRFSGGGGTFRGGGSSGRW